MKIKFTIKRIVGLIEFLFGISLPIIALFRAIKADNYWPFVKYIWALPLYYYFTRNGWRWMTRTVNIYDEKNLNINDAFYIEAVSKAQKDIETFKAYLSKGTFSCFAYVISEKGDRYWVRVNYCDNNYILIDNLTEKIKRKKKISPLYPYSGLHDWIVIMEDSLVGYYTYRAFADKAEKEGYKLSYQSQEILKHTIN